MKCKVNILTAGRVCDVGIEPNVCVLGAEMNSLREDELEMKLHTVLLLNGRATVFLSFFFPLWFCSLKCLTHRHVHM